MHITTHDTTSNLCNKLNMLKEDREHWRCIHLKLSALPLAQNPHRWSSFLVKELTHKLAEFEGAIYACEDADIFILFQGRAQPILAKLADHFVDINTSGKRSGGLYYVYDLSKEWLFLFFLAHRKRNQQSYLFANA